MSEKNGQETAAVQPPCPAGEELVSYTAPLLPWRNERDIFVSVNGESIRIKRGETVQIRDGETMISYRFGSEKR